MVQFNRWSAGTQVEIRKRDDLVRAMQRAFRQVGIPWGECYHEDVGDAILVLAPAEVPKALFVEFLPAALVEAVRRKNETYTVDGQLRITMALHAGEVFFDEHGMTAPSVVHALRLLNASPVKTALASSPGVLALITSDWFFEEVVRHSSNVDPATFRATKITNKETVTTGWIQLPDRPYSSASQWNTLTALREVGVFSQKFWLAVAVRTGVIYTQSTLAMYIAIAVETGVPTGGIASRLIFDALLGAIMINPLVFPLLLAVGSGRNPRTETGWFLTAARLVPPVGAAVVACLLFGLPGPVVVILTGVVGLLSALNPLLDRRTFPEVGAVKAAGQPVVDQCSLLVDRAVEDPQVKNIGLNQAELTRLRAHIEQEVISQAGAIARATDALHEQYRQAKARYEDRSRSRLVVSWFPRFLWCSVILATTSVFVGTSIVMQSTTLASMVAVTVPLAAAALRLAPTIFRLAANIRVVTFVLVAVGTAAITVTTTDLLLGRDVVNAGLLPVGVTALLSFGLLRLTVPWHRRARLLRSDNPGDWPEGDSVVRAEAVRSHEEWMQAMYEVGVLRIIGSMLEGYGTRSYDLELPPASVGKLGEITEPTQFVPTETSNQLKRMLESMPSAAIGLSGPRGVGKSTVLRVLSEFPSGINDCGLIVPAPTSYDAREFLTHLFTRLCEAIVPNQIAPEVRSTRQRRWQLVLGGVGFAVVTVALLWSRLTHALAWLHTHVQVTAIAVGMVLIVAATVWRWLRNPRPTSPVEELARRYLRTLRYLETQTFTTTGQAKTPIGDLGTSRARQRAEISKTYPELVDEFRRFLEHIGLNLRSRPDSPNAKIIICIDELDKIGTPEQAELFLNDIKAIFRVRHSFFLVSVSEDAMTSFARRALAVRTTFDTAFDAVVEVNNFLLADTRALLVQQVIRLPEPFVWFCHCMSGGLPRDIGRIVRALYDIRTNRSIATLDALTRELTAQEVRTVAHGQLMRTSGRAGVDSGRAVRWMAEINETDMCPLALLSRCKDAPAVSDNREDDLIFLVAQCCSHLYYAATVLEVFAERLSDTVAWLKADERPIELLARARAQLSVEPGLAWRSVDQFRELVPGLDTVPPPTAVPY